MPELAEVFRQFGPQYLKRFRDRMLPSHIRALRDITECRTEALGGHIFQCDQCETLHYAYHSCKNRHCTKCHGTDTRNWLEKWREKLLPVLYFHLVFTLPKELREIVRGHQKVLFGVLSQAAAYSLIKLASDPHFVGGSIGILAVVHTWTRAMIYHLHVYLLATGGGISRDGTRWLPARKGFLVPVTALSVIFRAKFMELARSALPEVKFPKSLWSKEWVVYTKPAVYGTEKALNYLARYVHRVVITNRRIISIENGRVQFRYKDSREKMWKTISIEAMEFIRRFLQHVLPRGFHKVRCYGIFAPSNRHLLNKARKLLAKSASSTAHPVENGQKESSLPQCQPMLCPSCKIGHLFLVQRVPPKGRSPP